MSKPRSNPPSEIVLMSPRRPAWLRPPARLKPWLVPAWNALVHGGRRLGDRTQAVAAGRVGRCLVCGRVALTLVRPRVIAPELVRRWGLSPREVRAFARKEAICSRCGAMVRGHRLARVLLDLWPVGDPPRPASTLRAWATSSEARRLRIAEINRIDGLHAILAGLPGLAASDFVPGAEPGATTAGVRHEDLSRLTYPDAAFDLVLTSETLEHVPDLDAALAEIRRVLVPGGRHLFTVPVRPGVAHTFARARLDASGTTVDLATPIAHPGGDWGYPVFTEFGLDLPEILRAAGFTVETYFGPTTEDHVEQVYVARKPPAP